MNKINLKTTIYLAVFFCLFPFLTRPSLAAGVDEPCTFPNHSECTGTDCDVASGGCYCNSSTSTCYQTFWGGDACAEDYQCRTRSCIPYNAGRSDKYCSCRNNDDCVTEDSCTNQKCLPRTGRFPGTDCTANAECLSGECRGGFCTCSNDEQCGAFVCQSGSCTETVAASPITCTCCLKPDGTGFVGEIHDAGADASSCQTYCRREGFPGMASWGTQTFLCAEDQPINDVPVEWTSPIGSKSPSQLIGKVIKTVLGIIGAIALLIFVYGGLMWMTSGGSADKIKKAQTTLVWAVIGLTVIFASYTLVDFVIKAF